MWIGPLGGGEPAELVTAAIQPETVKPNRNQLTSKSGFRITTFKFGELISDLK